MKVSELSETDQKRLEAIRIKDRLTRDDLFTLVALTLRLEEGLSAPSKSQVEKVGLKILDAIATTVHKGQAVQITGFGTFDAHESKSRMARNPQTGEKIKAPARKTPRFSPGALFVQYLNGRALPKKGPIIGKAAKGSGEAIYDFVKAGVNRRKFVKKESV